MRNMTEHFTTMIVMMVLSFLFVILISISLQTMNARLIHTSAIEKLQASYYGIDLATLNQDLEEGWYFEIRELSSVASRKDYEVLLHYHIDLPLIDENGMNATLTGYAH